MSLYFNSSADYIITENSTNFAFGTDNFTIEMWYRPTAKQNDFPNILNNAISWGIGSWAIEDRHNLAPTKITLWNYSFSQVDPLLTSTSEVVNGTWYHIALVRNGTDLRLYIDGVSEDSVVFASSFDAAASYQIGTGNGNDYLNGHLQELRISDMARWTTGFTPELEEYTSDANTLLLFHMNGDVSDGEHSFTVSDAKLNAETTKFDGSMYFDGTDYITTESSTDLAFGTGDFTIDLWYNPSSRLSSFPGIVQNDISDIWGENEWSLHDRHNSWPTKFAFQLYNDGSFILESTTVVANDTWYHLAVTRYGNIFRLFVNGVIEDTYESSVNIDNGVSHPVILGGQGNGRINGFIDELRISKGIARWTEGFTPNDGPYSL
jgi:hypothetical protein